MAKKKETTESNPKPDAIVPVKDEKPSAPTVKVDMPEIALSVETVQKYICEKATKTEIELFLQTCMIWKLNPFKREIYLVKYQHDKPASTVIGYESFLKRADRTARLSGWRAWTEGVPKNPDFKAIVEIHRKDWAHPFIHEVFYSEYVQRTSQGTITRFWDQKPRTMIKKVAIAQAFRLCFPDELGGMPCLAEEIMDAEVIDTSPIKPGEAKGGNGPASAHGKIETAKGEEQATIPKEAEPAPPPPPSPPKQEPKAAPRPVPRPRPAPSKATPTSPAPARSPSLDQPPPAAAPAKGSGESDEDTFPENGSDGDDSNPMGSPSPFSEEWDDKIRLHLRTLTDRLGRDSDKLHAVIIDRIRQKFGIEVTELTGPELNDEQKDWLVKALIRTIDEENEKRR